MTRCDLAVFTICSNNYVPMARILLESARASHPDATFYLCLADEPLDDPEFYPAGCEVVPARSLEIPDFAEFTFRYDVMELNTAVKPFMFRRLLQNGHGMVLYFDPDIEVFAPLESVLGPLRGGASFVLTPHLLRPAEGDAFPDDIGIMRAGIYNLGFLGVGAGAEAEGVLHWWSRRLLHQCISAQDQGIFVDQKFMDLVPGFADRVHVLRDPAVNVAYWNLTQRRLTQEGNHWFVDGRPLGFFHYSGINPRDLTRLSKYTEAFRGDAIPPPLTALMRRYADRLLALGHGTIPAGLYAYGRFASGTPIPDVVRHMFRERHLAWQADPFRTYEEYLHLPTPATWSGPRSSVSHLMAYLHARERWLNGNFNLLTQEGVEGYTRWMLDHSRPILPDPRLVQPVAERIGRRAVPARRPPPHTPGEPDVNVIGYLRLALGTGEAGRLRLRSLRHAGLAARGLATNLNSSSAATDTSCEPLLEDTARGRFNILSINGDQLPQVIEHLRPVMRPDAYRIAAPFWELADFPAPWLAGFAEVDEVWAPTAFIQTALVRKLDKPVLRMPLPLEFDPPSPRARAGLGLPDGAFLFFFAFDYFSFIARKNPAASIAAFKRAFRGPHPEPRARLVVKTMNAEIVPEASRALRDALRDDPDVILIERTLSREDTLALIAACDALVSLHRSEGLGLLVAEAMVLGKPVISTDYSATTELVTPGTGYPVDYRLIPVKEGEYPFHEGQVWADPDLDHAAWQMRRVLRRQDEAADRVAAARQHVAEHYGMDVVARRAVARLRQIEGC